MRPITASDLMNPEVLTVRDDMTVRDLAAFLIENEISGAPVEDAEGRLVGVVSLVDIAAAASGEGHRLVPRRLGLLHRRRLGGGARTRRTSRSFRSAQEGLRVADIMNPKIYSVHEDATVSEIASLMLKGHIHRLLVTREDRAVGVITTSDLLGLLVGEDWRSRFRSRPGGPRTRGPHINCAPTGRDGRRRRREEDPRLLTHSPSSPGGCGGG